MLNKLPPFAKEQLYAAGLKLVVPWLECAEFQLSAMWPQLHFGVTSNTAITQKSRAAIECVKQSALTLKHLTANNRGPSYNFAEELFEYSGPFFNAESYFQPLTLGNLPAKQRVAVHRLLGVTDKLPRTGNHPALSFLAELKILHSQLASAWFDVHGLNRELDQAFKDRLAKLVDTITELRVLCLETHEARMSAFAMTLVQLLIAIDNDLELDWLGLPHEIREKHELVKIVSEELPQLVRLVSSGMSQFLQHLRFVPIGLESPHVLAAIAAGKLVVIMACQRVYLQGQDLTNAFKKSPQSFNDLVDLCRAARRHRLVEFSDYPGIDEGTFRSRFHRLQKISELLLPYLEKGDRKQTHRLTLPPSEIVLIERQPDPQG